MNEKSTAQEHDDVPYAIDDAQATELFWEQAVVHRGIDGFRRRRGAQKAPTKELISIRLDKDIVRRFRQMGNGWQGKINTILFNWLKENE